MDFLFWYELYLPAFCHNKWILIKCKILWNLVYEVLDFVLIFKTVMTFVLNFSKFTWNQFDASKFIFYVFLEIIKSWLMSMVKLALTPTRNIAEVFLICLVGMETLQFCVSSRNYLFYYSLHHVFTQLQINLCHPCAIDTQCFYAQNNFENTEKFTMHSLANAYCIKFIKY